ncbi:MAG TPA: FAD-binding oxidoreductase [Chloroflexia bacterium]|nr:FAD-binding oxidoreductase [Chloroflexia bacterium]
MQRWNGWGSDTVDVALAPDAIGFLAARLGSGAAAPDAPLAAVLQTVPASRLPAHPLVTIAPEARVAHARGQSLPDWIALRSGRLGVVPDGVAYPTTRQEVRALLQYAAAVGACLIPYGGGTSVVGHINPEPGPAPVLTVDLRRMQRLRSLSPVSRLAVFEAGIAGPMVEAHLRAAGYTLGHFPQSFEFSTLGGWVATRSSGQQSLGYGRIEQLFAGGHLEAPAGSLDLPPFPASAAGPDLRALILGSEGRLGILTEATVRITPLPEREEFHGVFFRDWEHGLGAARRLSQEGLLLSLVRLSTPAETATLLALGGHARAVHTLERYLALRGIGAGKCLLLLGCSGRTARVAASRRQALRITRQYHGVSTGQALGQQWLRSRFRLPYLRNALWDQGYAVDTVETAADWSRVPALLAAVERALQTGLADVGERVHATAHLSHLYPTGSSIYTTYLYRRAGDPHETLRRWQVLKAAASRAIVAAGGTISHHHGVGADHRPYLEAEKGALGLATLRAMGQTLDPAGLMNPGKLIP